MTPTDAPPSRSDRRRLLGGSVQVMAADALALPTGLIVAGVLARAFGPDGYGVLALALSLIGAVEWGIVALFSRATVTLVGGSDDSRTAATVLRWHLYAGLIGGAAIGAAAGPLAMALDEPRVRTCLLVLAFGVPVVALSAGCRSILTGRRLFSRRAAASAVRWTARMICIGSIVWLGFPIAGAAAGSVLASTVTLTVAWTMVRRSHAGITSVSTPTTTRFWHVAIPTFVLTVSLRLLERVGVVALKAFGAPTADVGWYAAAQNFTAAPGLFAMTFGPLLLATLTRQIAGGTTDDARALSQDVLRAVIVGTPVLAILAGSADDIVRMIYGAGFEPAARLAPPFLLAAIATSFISVASAILTAAGRARAVGRAAWPILPIAIIGYAWTIPRFGAMGAAVVTCTATAIAATLSLSSVYALWRIAPPVATSIRALLISIGAYLAMTAWDTTGLWWVVKAAVLTAAVAPAYVVLGEWTRAELARAVASARKVWARSIS